MNREQILANTNEPELDLTLNELRSLSDLVKKSIDTNKLYEAIHDIYLFGYNNALSTKGIKADEQADSPMESQSIQRFIKSLDKASDFKHKHDKSGGFSTEQLTYLSYLAYSGEVHKAIVNSYDVAFQKGYKTAKKEFKSE